MTLNHLYTWYHIAIIFLGYISIIFKQSRSINYLALIVTDYHKKSSVDINVKNVT